MPLYARRLDSVRIDPARTAHISLADIATAVMHGSFPNLGADWPAELPRPSAQQLLQRRPAASSSSAKPEEAPAERQTLLQVLQQWKQQQLLRPPELRIKVRPASEHGDQHFLQRMLYHPLSQLYPALDATWPCSLDDKICRLQQLSDCHREPGSPAAQPAAVRSQCHADLANQLRLQLPAVSREQRCPACCPLCTAPCLKDKGHSSRHTTQHAITGLASWTTRSFWSKDKLCKHTCGTAVTDQMDLQKVTQNVSLSASAWEEQHSSWQVPHAVATDLQTFLFHEYEEELARHFGVRGTHNDRQRHLAISNKPQLLAALAQRCALHHAMLLAYSLSAACLPIAGLFGGHDAS